MTTSRRDRRDKFNKQANAHAFLARFSEAGGRLLIAATHRVAERDYRAKAAAA